MIKKDILFLITIFILLPLITFSAEIHAVNCCQLNHEITLDDITVKARADGQLDVGDPIEYQTIEKRASYAFLDGAIVGEVHDEDDDGIIDPPTADLDENECYVGNTIQLLDVSSPSWGMVCLVNTIYNITDWVFWFALALAIIMGGITGFFFMTAGGEPYKAEKARSMFIWVVVGIAVAVSAKVITALIMAVVL